MRKKTGDTLVEVTIAIGIFSMVAVAVVTIVNNSTSRAQTALETTLAREEIDVQAEAIRFIQNSYTTSLRYPQSTQSDDSKDFGALWDAIIEKALSPNGQSEKYLSYHPKTCDELYDKNALKEQGVFVVNPKGLPEDHIEDKETIIVRVVDLENNSAFRPTITYPQLVFGDGNILKEAGGIYVVTFKGSDSYTDSNGQQSPTYYDFYIRTCWYGLGAKLPSTISTVIRLTNPRYLVRSST